VRDSFVIVTVYRARKESPKRNIRKARKHSKKWMKA
jgi:hypothetical protein